LHADAFKKTVTPATSNRKILLQENLQAATLKGQHRFCGLSSKESVSKYSDSVLELINCQL